MQIKPAVRSADCLWQKQEIQRSPSVFGRWAALSVRETPAKPEAVTGFRSFATYPACLAGVLAVRAPCPTQAQLEALDDAFISRNLSPGGCADLLAVTYFLHSLLIEASLTAA